MLWIQVCFQSGHCFFPRGIYTWNSKWPLCSKVNPRKQGLNSNQKKGHERVPGMTTVVSWDFSLLLRSRAPRKPDGYASCKFLIVIYPKKATGVMNGGETIEVKNLIYNKGISAPCCMQVYEHPKILQDPIFFVWAFREKFLFTARFHLTDLFDPKFWGTFEHRIFRTLAISLVPPPISWFEDSLGKCPYLEMIGK